MSSSTAKNSQPYDGPPPPLDGQVFTDARGGYWKIQRLTLAQNPAGFYLVHLSYGRSLEALDESMVLGPREFAALVREQELKAHQHSA